MNKSMIFFALLLAFLISIPAGAADQGTKDILNDPSWSNLVIGGAALQYNRNDSNSSDQLLPDQNNSGNSGDLSDSFKTDSSETGNNNPSFAAPASVSSPQPEIIVEDTTQVPEPTSLFLLGTGLGCLGLAAYRRKRK